MDIPEYEAQLVEDTNKLNSIKERAKRLGWNGGGTIWGLIGWSRVCQVGRCAGPNARREIDMTLDKVKERLDSLEASNLSKSLAKERLVFNVGFVIILAITILLLSIILVIQR